MFQRVEGDPVVSPHGSVRLRARLGACVERTLPAYAQNPVKFGDASNYLHFQTSWRKFRSDTYYLQNFVRSILMAQTLFLLLLNYKMV